MDESRAYKHSREAFFFIVPIFGFLFVGFVALGLKGQWLYALPGLLVVIVTLFSFAYSLTSTTVINEYEISIQTLLGTKTLKWGEIARVSGVGNRIKLHNFDGDVTLSPNASVPQYEELVEFIGSKRPNLFAPDAFKEMSTSWVSVLTMPVLGVFIIIAGIFIYVETAALVPLIISGIVGLAFIGITLAAPQAISIKNDSIVIGYLFKERTLLAYEVEEIRFDYLRNKYGRRTANYYVDIKILNGGFIRVGNMRPGLPIVYHALKNWHKTSS